MSRSSARLSGRFESKPPWRVLVRQGVESVAFWLAIVLTGGYPVLLLAPGAHRFADLGFLLVAHVTTLIVGHGYGSSNR
ncbi:MAG: hypothetical protein ABEJ58_00215 [Halodesulfurarchaeum sp.]